MPVGEERGERRTDLGDGAILGEHRQGESLPDVGPGFADPVEKAEVLREAAERDVLAVVGRRIRIALALRQRLYRATERRTSLVERHVDACVDEVERRGETGQSAADNGSPHRTRPRATTASLLRVERRHDRSKTSKPFSSMRSSCPR